jgi:hypothetical protein
MLHIYTCICNPFLIGAPLKIPGTPLFMGTRKYAYYMRKKGQMNEAANSWDREFT